MRMLEGIPEVLLLLGAPLPLPWSGTSSRTAACSQGKTTLLVLLPNSPGVEL
jgi:hypothetical protein